MATSFNLLPPEDPDNPQELLRFRCGDCKETFFSSELESHASAKHRAGAITVNTSLGKNVIDNRHRDSVLGYNVHKDRKTNN